MIKYFNENTILPIIKEIDTNNVIVTDNLVIKELIDKYNKGINIHYYSRKDLKQGLSNIKPNIVILLFYSKKTINYINLTFPNTVIYVLEVSDNDKIVNEYVEELEEIAV